MRLSRARDGDGDGDGDASRSMRRGEPTASPMKSRASFTANAPGEAAMSSYDAMCVEARAVAARAALTSTDSVSFLLRSEETLSEEKSRQLVREEEKKEIRKMKKTRKQYKKSMLVMSPQRPAFQRWEAVMMMLLCYSVGDAVGGWIFYAEI